ncbi:MAG: hypothetical protein AAB563_01995 [Patescibacteria group bacterium]
MVLNITTSDVPLTDAWLLEQLEKLQAFEYSYDPGQTDPFLQYYWESDSARPRPGVLLWARIDTCINDITTIFRIVLFGPDSTAYVSPDFGLDGLADPQDHMTGEDKYLSVWTKGTWMDGLAALAKSVTSRSFGLGSEESQRVSQLLNELASIAPKPAQVEVST